MEPRVSVVVPTFRRLDLLERCLHALRNQTLAPGTIEVLGVDDGREDRVQARVEALARSTGLVVRYLRPDPPGRGHGPRRAQGPPRAGPQT